MLDLIIQSVNNPRLMTMLFAAIAAGATVFSLISPLFANDGLNKRMRAVADERERIRQRERDRLARTEKVALRQSPRQVVQKVVADFNLTKWLAQEEARDKLVMAGFRGEAPYTTFLFFRLVVPVVLLLVTVVYVFFILKLDHGLAINAAICLGAAYLGMQAPMIYLNRSIKARQLSIKRAFPDALDLLLICVESGMSVEMAFRRVATEMASQSVALAEEFTLTTAELSYLADRRVAYDNLQKRTGLDSVKSVCIALAQSERYGTPLGMTLRVLAQENRDARMTEAEKKAAALPPMLTVPMTLFFLPVLFVVILSPVGMRISKMGIF
jgi:tight adherence protein C